MASTQSSPVLVQHASPPHTLSSEINVAPLPNTILESQRMEPERPVTPPVNETTADGREQIQEDSQPDTPMADAAAVEPSAEESTTVQPETEILQTSSEPAQLQDQPQTNLPVTSDEQRPAEEPVSEDTAQDPTPGEDTGDGDATQNTDPSPEQTEAAPPPPNPDIPEWVTWEDDTSVPDEAEIKELGSEKSALDSDYLEKKFFSEVDDPEQRPVKKIRLSWVIKGVRGTREHPNRARVMNSPCAYIDGHYWQIKFFPRGNKSSSLSAYIRCSRKEPKPDSETPESTFLYFEGPPDANVGEGAEPKNVLKIPATPAKSSENPATAEPEKSEGATKVDGESTVQANDEVPSETEVQPEAVEQSQDEPQADPTSQQDPAQQDSAQQPTLDSDDTTESMTEVTPESAKQKQQENEDYRVSAQLGMTIYNPAEPRTAAFNSSEHQFTRYNDDWGWTNFVGPWQDIHKRQRGERQALLRNDTIAIDAYIRVFEDPSQALWWHRSHEHENIWPSKKLAGYFPMGTPPLYHSPAVAGITAWLLLAPFRKIIEEFDAGKWRHDSQIKPRPLIARLQQVLHVMRHLKRDEYVNVHPVIETLREYGEAYSEVLSFWEVFRRSIALEIGDSPDTLQEISKILDADGKTYTTPVLPVRGIVDVQHALSLIQLPSQFESGLPNFLPLSLEREVFDKMSREWKLYYDKVTLNDEIEVSSSKCSAKYTLYGFMVHVGERNSGRFYSILRPNGLGTKWLSFEDGDGNKVYSYTRKRIEEYEGLVGDELDSFKSTRQTAYMAMYIKNDCFKDYLPGSLGEYRAPKWLEPVQDTDDTPMLDENTKETEDENIALEIYHDEGILGRQGLLDMFNVKQQCLAGEHFNKLTVPRDMTFQELRQKLADERQLAKSHMLRIFVLAYGDSGQYTSARWGRAPLSSKIGDRAKPGRPLCLWTSVLKTEEETKLFGCPNEVLPPSIPETEITAPTEESSADAAAEIIVTDAPADTLADAPIDATADTAAVIATDNPADAVEDQQATGRDSEPVETITDTEQNNPIDVQGTQANQELDTPAQPNSVFADAETVPPELSSQTVVVENAMSHVSSGDNTADLTETRPAEVTQTTETESTNETPAVVHGHLVDAVMDDMPPPQSNVMFELHATETQQTQAAVDTDINMDDANDAAIAALIAADVQALNGSEESIIVPDNDATNETGNPPDPSHAVTEEEIAEMDTGNDNDNIDTTPATETPTIEVLPVRNVYGFIQMFDTEKQDFFVHSTFFARSDEAAKQAIRRSLGYDKDKRFHIWHREGLLDGSTVNETATFDEIQFADGVDMIVGEILSEDRIQQLRREGKFSNPFALSRYLRMKEREHPTQSKTTTEDVEIKEFGQNVYRGPLMNGQPHGEKCFMITANGHTYEGPLVQNQKEGKAGKITYQNGDTYEGEWLNDERHGQGVFVAKRTGNKYVGGFQNGKRWGKGTTYWEVADEEADMCQICYSEDIDALFFDCGHVCACMSCAKQCECCPICRKSIRQVVRMFWA